MQCRWNINPQAGHMVLATGCEISEHFYRELPWQLVECGVCDEALAEIKEGFEARLLESHGVGIDSRRQD